MQRLAWHAWHVAAFSRQKRLGRGTLATLIRQFGGSAPSGRGGQTAEEQIAIARMVTALVNQQGA